MLVLRYFRSRGKEKEPESLQRVMKSSAELAGIVESQQTEIEGLKQKIAADSIRYKTEIEDLNCYISYLKDDEDSEEKRLTDAKKVMSQQLLKCISLESKLAKSQKDAERYRQTAEEKTLANQQLQTENGRLAEELAELRKRMVKEEAKLQRVLLQGYNGGVIADLRLQCSEMTLNQRSGRSGNNGYAAREAAAKKKLISTNRRLRADVKSLRSNDV